MPRRRIHQNRKSQSAMEYLMTYGWAILIIAVVLGALFQLGVFSGIGTPRAQPGNCQVVKVGTGITQTISLAGECQGQEPEYAAKLNGASSKITINIPSSELPTGTAQRTVTAWFSGSNYANSGGGNIFAYGVGSCNYDWFSTDVGQYPNQLEINMCGSNQAFPPTLNANTWYFVAYEYNGIAQIGYLGSSGQLSSPITETFAANTEFSPFYVGWGWDPPGYWNGFIANVQLYNTSLSQAEVTALYQEGIGGAPINPQNIVGWWPLNGNENDYSGNNNNGQPTGITFSSSWTSGYTAP